MAYKPSHRSARPQYTRRVVGAFTILVTLVLVLAAFPGEGTPTAVSAVLSPTGTTVAVASTVQAGAEDGFIPDGEGLSPFDTGQPAIANLDPDLLAAVQQAATDAKAASVVMVISSGWRSKRYQQVLLDDAIAKYGSLKKARRWVDTPERSMHVSGDAVDIGFTDADYWLIEHGNRYGLCQTYANEVWHFELAVEPGGTCPAPLRDATSG